MKYFYDTEFLDDGKMVDLISIGIRAEDGREFYAVNFEALGRSGSGLSKRIGTHDWLMENVMGKVTEWPAMPFGSVNGILGRYEIRDRLYSFLTVGAGEHEADVELWADYPAYDHVALCQLWGPMCDLPTGMPYRTNCLKQHSVHGRRTEEMLSLGILGLTDDRDLDIWTPPSQDPATEHHALWDARHNFAWAKRMGLVADTAPDVDRQTASAFN